MTHRWHIYDRGKQRTATISVGSHSLDIHQAHFSVVFLSRADCDINSCCTGDIFSIPNQHEPASTTNTSLLLQNRDQLHQTPLLLWQNNRLFTPKLHLISKQHGLRQEEEL